jgi:hypothetical protein
MWIQGRRRGGAKALSKHLQKTDENESVTVQEIEGFSFKELTDENLDKAIRQMEAIGYGKGAKRNLYHVIIAPAYGETLNAAQKKEMVKYYAEQMGFKNHQYVLVEHWKKGKQHFHLVFNIIDPITRKTHELKWTKKREWRISRELEKIFGFSAPKPKGKPSRTWETQRGKRSGIDPTTMRKEITAVYHASRTGKEFIVNLKNAGYVLTIGKNGSYVLVDKAGDIHGLMRRIEGVNLKELQQKFPDLKNIPLPNLDSVLKQLRPTRLSAPKIHVAFRKSASKSTSCRHQNKANGHIKDLSFNPKRRGSLAPLPVSRHKVVVPEQQRNIGNSDSSTGKQPKAAKFYGLRKRPQNRSTAASGEKSAMPTISKSPLLAAAHATQWKELSARYAVRKQAARHEHNESTRDAMLAALDAEESAERIALAIRQQAESEADISAQSQNAAMQIEPIRSPTPKPN